MWRLISDIRQKHTHAFTHTHMHTHTNTELGVTFSSTTIVFFLLEVNVKPNLLNYNSIFLNDCLQTNGAFVYFHVFCNRQAIYL